MLIRTLFIIASAAPAVAAQAVPSTFTPAAHVDSVIVRGDTSYVAITVLNGVGSAYPVGAFAIETPATVVWQSRPAAPHWLLVQRKVDGHPSAVWAMPGSGVVREGGSSPSLSLAALGIPDVVNFWAVAYMPVPFAEDPDHEAPADPIASRSMRGVTVGVVPVPAGSTPGSLAARLHSLLTRACGPLGWVSNAGVCHSLDVKLSGVETALAAGRAQQAHNELSAFVNELDAQHGSEPGKHVGDAAYALLRGNAVYLLAKS